MCTDVSMLTYYQDRVIYCTPISATMSEKLPPEKKGSFEENIQDTQRDQRNKGILLSVNYLIINYH